jgi:hypothetical protein
LTQVQASNATALAAVETLAATTAGPDGTTAQYTVKVDNAGHVSGFGLSSTANTADPFSEFGIRADRFYVAPPAHSSATAPTTGLYKGYVWRDTSVNPNVTRYWTGSDWSTTAQVLPFVVKTSGSNPGVYLPAAFIEDATITTAKIAALAVDSAQIADGAIVTAKIDDAAITTAKIDDGQITNAKISNLSVDKLDGAALKVGAYIQSTDYASGANGAGWRINADGTAELQAAFIRGTLTAGQIASNSVTLTSVLYDANGVGYSNYF